MTALSADTGTAGDFITSVAAQTVSGTFTGTLAAGEKIQVSADGGTTWVDAIPVGSTWSASGVTLSAGPGTLAVRTIDTASNTTTGSGHSYTLDTVAPTAVATVTALSADTGTAGDFITSVAAQTVSGTFTGTLAAGEKIQVSADGGTTWVDAIPVGSTWSASGVTLSAGPGTLAVRTIDTASNTTTGSGHSYTLDSVAPTAVATVTALSADTGTAGDFITSVAAQTVSGTFTGTLAAGEKIQVSADGGTTWVDAIPVGSTWSASGVTLSAGPGTLAVRTIDTASNTTTGSGHSYTLDSVAPFIITTATVNILTNAGYDLSTLYADMHNSDPTIGVRDSTHFTSPNIGAGVVFNVVGNGLTYSVSGGNFDILSGTITALEIRNLSDNSLLVSMTGISFSGPDFDAAVGAYPVTTGLDSLFKTIAYKFTGGSGSDVAVGGNLNDTFIGGDGNDTLIGGAGLDRALYTGATGPITVAMAAGVVSGAGVGNDTLVSVEFDPRQ